MITSSSFAAGAVLTASTASATSTAAHSSSDEDSSASFSDVMQQHDEFSGPSDDAPAPPSATPAKPAGAQTPLPDAMDLSAEDEAVISQMPRAATVIPTAPTLNPVPPLAPTPANATSRTFAPASNLSTLIIQALVQASTAPAARTAPTSSAPAEPSDLSALIGRAPAQLAGGKTMMTAATGKARTSSGMLTASSSGAAKNSGSATTGPQGSTATAATPIDLSALIASTSILAQVSTASAGKDLPSPGSVTGAVGNVAKEKKSTPASAGGSFLQSGTVSSTAAESAFGMLLGLPAATSGVTVKQQLTPSTGTKSNSLDAIAPTASTTAGTANVEKEKAMNAELNIPELTLLSGNGGNAVSSQSSADLHIQLASNTDFTDALKQVMHVAQLTQTSESRTPMRVEMEIQTPPGAIVNVYVSRQDDGWRAQLSTNDPTALSWVQDQVSSLRQSSDLGVEVKWLPPQLESGTAVTTSSSQDSNLSWNQGGQGRSNDGQPDERRPSGRPPEAEATPDLATAASNPFATTLAALGRAA